MTQTLTMWEEIEEAYETVYRRSSVNRIEGSNASFQWKVYRVAGEIIRIDVQPKGP